MVFKVLLDDSNKFLKWDLAFVFFMWKGMKKVDLAYVVYLFKLYIIDVIGSLIV